MGLYVFGVILWMVSAVASVGFLVQLGRFRVHSTTTQWWLQRGMELMEILNILSFFILLTLDPHDPIQRWISILLFTASFVFWVFVALGMRNGPDGKIYWSWRSYQELDPRDPDYEYYRSSYPE